MAAIMGSLVARLQKAMAAEKTEEVDDAQGYLGDASGCKVHSIRYSHCQCVRVDLAAAGGEGFVW